MATFPTFETVLLEIAKALGATTTLTSKTKSKFKQNSLNLENLQNTWIEILNNIFDALEIAEPERKDLVTNIKNGFTVHKAVELKVFTFSASPRKVVWQYLARVLIPALARHCVFWNTADKLDSGMPGGKFWYLPFLDPTKPDAKIELPVQQVLNWLLDLIEQPKASIAETLEDELRIYNSTGNVLKNMYNWQKGKNTPEISSIKELFPDEVSIQFKGCFEPNEGSPYFEQALDFVKYKGLSADELQYEIPLDSVTISNLMNGECDHETQENFANRVYERFHKPSIKTIRQRLLVARAIQDGYDQLVKFLTPNVNKFCTDITKNKTLQLLRIYEYTYNLTLASVQEFRHINNTKRRERAENKYFTEKLPPFCRYDLLLTVAHDEYDTISEAALKLNSTFREDNYDYLQDIWFATDEKFKEINKNTFKQVEENLNLEKSIHNLKARLTQNKSPYKSIQKVDDFDVIYSLCQYDFPSPKIIPILLSRLEQIAKTQEQQLLSILLQLDSFLVKGEMTKHSEKLVEKLLDSAYSNPSFEKWEASIQRYDAYHHIAKNELKQAEKILKSAIKKCNERSYGSLKGELARNAFALAIANQKLIPENHETYFRDILLWGGWESAQYKDIYEVSRELHEYFWQDFYKCYPSYEPLYSDFTKDINPFIEDFHCAVIKNKPIETVLKKHKHLRKKQLKYPQADSILLLFLKKIYENSSLVANTKQAAYAAGLANDVKQFESLQLNILINLRVLINEWPDIIDIADFKKQTPLMMAVNNNDYETANALLEAGANPNLQDIKGRTALHTASAIRSLECTKLLIKYGANEKITSIGGATALHTAVRMGQMDIAEFLVDKFPYLLDIQEFGFRTPLMLAESLANDEQSYISLNHFLKAEKRSTVSQAAYKKLHSILLTRSTECEC